MKYRTFDVLHLLLFYSHQIHVASPFTPIVTHSTTRLASSPRRICNDIPVAFTATNCDFWGCPRSKEEIQEFVSDAVFSCPSKVRVLSTEPPLVVIDEFLEEELCDEIVESAITQGGLKRSTMGSEQDTSDFRTSETTWLKEKDCEMPLRTVAHRVSRLSCQPPSHMENLQVVRYSIGQKFDLHTDHLNEFNDLECRGRLATCLIYLNSAGEQSEEIKGHDGLLSGGETSFPEFDVTVSPIKGSAVFFWNTLERPGSEGYDSHMNLNVDMRLRHAGLPVLSGVKWICNRWIHPIPLGAGVRGL